MLTKETLIANEALKGLTDEQISAITTLSENDESVVIGKRIGEVYRQMDETIETATGVKRNGDEKTYLFLERATKAFAEKYNDYDALKTKIADLEAQVAKGGDEALKAQLASATKELQSTKNAFTALKGDYDKAQKDHENALNAYKIDTEIARAKEGIQFKTGFSEAVMNTLIAQAIANVKAKNPSFEERNGASVLIFHDENGAPLNNAENKLNPFTAKELLMKEFETMDILDKKPSKGGGGKQPDITPKDILGATTQVEATEIINKMLFDRGIAKTSLSFQEEFNKIWKDNEIGKLPMK